MTIAKQLEEATRILHESNTAAERLSEKRIEEFLRAYINNGHRGHGRKFIYGGVSNLLGTIAGLCEENSRRGDDDWAIAQELIEECADKCDLKYTEDV